MANKSDRKPIARRKKAKEAAKGAVSRPAEGLVLE